MSAPGLNLRIHYAGITKKLNNCHHIVLYIQDNVFVKNLKGCSL